MRRNKSANPDSRTTKVNPAAFPVRDVSIKGEDTSDIENEKPTQQNECSWWYTVSKLRQIVPWRPKWRHHTSAPSASRVNPFFSPSFRNHSRNFGSLRYAPSELRGLQPKKWWKFPLLTVHARRPPPRAVKPAVRAPPATETDADRCLSRRAIGGGRTCLHAPCSRPTWQCCRGSAPSAEISPWRPWRVWRHPLRRPCLPPPPRRRAAFWPPPIGPSSCRCIWTPPRMCPSQYSPPARTAPTPHKKARIIPQHSVSRCASKL